MTDIDEDQPVDRSRHVKEAIREAAGTLFAEQGFGATGIRDIAAKAGVDPALIIRHFGSKEGLFLRTMRVGGAFSEVMNGTIDHLGDRVVRFILSDTADSSVRGIFVALLRASDRPEVQEQLRSSLQASVIDPILDRLEGENRELRARLFAAQMSGLMSALWVSADPFLAAAHPHDIVAIYGPHLQSLLTSAALTAGPDDQA